MLLTMKKIGVLFLLVIFGSCESDKSNQVQADCIPTSLQNGIIAFYPFSNGSINDFSGNSYNLTNTSAASSGADRAGNPNCAFNFVSANGDFLKYTNPTFLNNFQTLPFSISLWYKTSSPTTASYELLIGRDTGLHCPDTNGQWSVGLYDLRNPAFGINEYSLWDDVSTLTTPWKHLVVTCHGTDLKLYINGALTTQTAGTGCGGTSFPTTNTGDLFLGKDFTGLLDDVIIYNHVLTATEINELYNLPACCQ